ncbi:MAG: hypothetical protein RI955_1719 [Bacteroidota bacterium]
MRTIILLALSNIFMTFAWYGHLRFQHVALWKVILIAWGIAFFEYCLMVPANRLGKEQFNVYQLKTIQEVISLIVFSLFAVFFLGEPFHWRYAVAFLLIIVAVYIIFSK